MAPPLTGKSLILHPRYAQGIMPSDLSRSTGARFSVTEGTHTATNILVTVTLRGRSVDRRVLLPRACYKSRPHEEIGQTTRLATRR